MNQTETIQAGYCGLYCEACTIYIATKEYPERLAILASKFGISKEKLKCFGCRSETKWSYCRKCKFAACAYVRMVDSCVECNSYPCDGIRELQSAKANTGIGKYHE